MTALENMPIDEQAAKLKDLLRHPGMAAIEELHATRMAEVQAKINSLNTPPAETQEHKRALEALKHASPRHLTEALINTAQNEMRKAAKKQ